MLLSDHCKMTSSVKSIRKMYAIILVMVPVTASIFTGCGNMKSSPIEDFEYEFDDGEVTITGYKGADLEIVVPDMIKERPVTRIGKEAFKGYDMKSIVIPNGVTVIEHEVFNGCENLENITLPDSIQSTVDVYESGLDDTKWYENQEDGLLYISNVLIGYKGASDNAPAELEIKDGTTCIANSAFKGFFELYNITIPNSVMYIRNYAFYDCPHINSINIPESVKEIGEKALGYLMIEIRYPFEIHGKSRSAAETYANENGLKFISE